ncbi:MAG: hypothetical protein BGN98_04880 [Microbacterium sp. 69-7]|uniref:hypothetical protein n=1 Tax=Microbacterium sp. 69-7 TaxID=1895784 RepID=UPI00096924C5|nr:hypothetical protein [Microbacterium sp. 69-7]OJU43103.1 MAG: hypothetical protein BGN98_04880 [Microbacterium sp. 69-7]
MNRISLAAALVVGVIALAGCSDVDPGASRESADPSSSAIDHSIPFNLGEKYDAATASVRARYDLPVDADYYIERYGAWVANESCTDAQVLAWQELRRATGETDEICRVVYEYSLAGTVYPIGCAAPVMVVSDEAR